jgi:hypothetical protein
MASIDAPEGLAALQSLVAAGPGQQTAAGDASDGPPPALMEMLRQMSAQKQQLTAASSLPPGPAGRAVSPAEVVPAPPPALVRAVKWSAQSSWLMANEEGRGLQLVVCEDDSTEQAEIAASGAIQPGPLTRLDPEPQSVACDLLLGADPHARILRVCVVSSSGTVQLSATPPGVPLPEEGGEEQVRETPSHPIPSHPSGGVGVHVGCVAHWCSSPVRAATADTRDAPWRTGGHSGTAAVQSAVRCRCVVHAHAPAF